MDNWAINTLRTIGIIITSGFIILFSLVLVAASMCFGAVALSSRDVGALLIFAIPAVLLFLGAGALIVHLGRGLMGQHPRMEPLLAEAAPMPAPPPPMPVPVQERTTSVSLRLSPASRKMLDRLVLAMVAQILISPVAWIFGQLRYWTAPNSLAQHNFVAVLLGPFILYHLPYGILIYFLLKRPSQRVLMYAVAVPSVILLHSLFSLGLVFHYYVHEPFGSLLLFLPWAIHVVVLALAYQAIQQTGLHPHPPRLMAGAALVFFYFCVIDAVTPLLYRFSWR